MKKRDILEVAIVNFKRRFKSNIGLIVIFSLVIVVFNLTCSLTSAVAKNASSNITENDNLKIISVSTIEEEISQKELDSISQILHVDMAVYDYCMSIAIEDSRGTTANMIGMDKEQVSYLVGEPVEFNEDSIVLNTSFEDLGVKIGDTIEISYNVRVSNTSGIRETKKFTVVAFYEQPVVETWYDNVVIASQENIFMIAEGLYGLPIEDIRNSSIYKQALLVFVDDVDNVVSVAKAIDNKGLITSYALAYSQELPLLAKTIIAVGAVIIAILLILGIVVMHTTLKNSIRGRYKEIGILKSIGMSEVNVFSILSAEIFLLWFMISVLAVIISVISVKVIPNILAFSTMGDFNISFAQIVISVLASYGVMFWTTVFIIRKAAKLNTIEVLRNE